MPTEVPTEEPTEEPTEVPTEVPTEEPTEEPIEPSPYTGRQYMPDVNVKYVLNDGTQIWTLLMDDNLTVAVRTYYPDGTATTYYYDATDDALYRYNGYNDGQAGVKVVGNYPAVGDEVLGGQAHIAEILEEGVLLDNGDMLITGIGIMPSETQVSDSGALTDDEIAQLKNELNPQPTQEPSEDAQTDETDEG